ncbi:hypothetical protein H5410_060525 [Solanum commersonii]|uniref:Uncharacterized protein n=1 Tax=Solanum commersonii TaxID=4109 RepID=A0A9J5W5W3_SOLCO|nr:hypothetical protein H5410_060525 [Solanum commersonii]
MGMEQNKRRNDKQDNLTARVKWESKRALVRNCFSGEGGDIHVLVETKLTSNDSNLYRQIWNNRWLGEVHFRG